MLDDGTYISWWPKENGRDYGYWGCGEWIGSFTVAAIPHRKFLEDNLDEKPQPPNQIGIEGLDEAAIEAWWIKFSSDPSNKWLTLTQNCSTVVSDALKVGRTRLLV